MNTTTQNNMINYVWSYALQTKNVVTIHTLNTKQHFSSNLSFCALIKITNYDRPYRRYPWTRRQT
jgi:hypothetical protein